MDQDFARRILIVDDDPAIRQMMVSLLKNAAKDETSTTKLARIRLYKNKPEIATRESHSEIPAVEYLVDMAGQGQQALELVKSAVARGTPYLMCFLDMRMPPGWDGVETMIRLWEVDPDLQIALCSAYSDYSWESIIARTGKRASLLIMKKPFDYAEMAQMALALSEKGLVTRRMAGRMETLERMVDDRTILLEESNRRLSAEIEEKEQARAEATELLEKTVNAIAESLISIIEMSNPLVFSHAKRIQSHMTLMVEALNLPNAWCYDLAAILSQLGCATIPDGTLRRYFSGADITFEERSMILAYPAASAELIGKIPRLDAIAAMMGFRDRLGDATLVDFAHVGPVEAGAWLLRTAIDFDILVSRHSKTEAVAIMRNARMDYPAELLDVLEEKVTEEAPRIGSSLTVPLLSLEKDMILNADITSRDGMIVARKDQRMSDPLLKRIRNFIQAGLIESELVDILISGDEKPKFLK